MAKEFEPFQKVLVRLNEGEVWKCAFYDRKGVGDYHLVIGQPYDPSEGNILPYNDDTKELLGTTKSPWTPKPGELVAVSISGMSWFAEVFIRKDGKDFLAKPSKDSGPTRYKLCEPLCKHFNVPKE